MTSQLKTISPPLVIEQHELGAKLDPINREILNISKKTEDSQKVIKLQLPKVIHDPIRGQM